MPLDLIHLFDHSIHNPVQLSSGSDTFSHDPFESEKALHRENPETPVTTTKGPRLLKRVGEFSSLEFPLD